MLQFGQRNAHGRDLLFRIFGSRNKDKKGVYTTWIVLSWNSDLIYFMDAYMKYPKNPKLAFLRNQMTENFDS